MKNIKTLLPFYVLFLCITLFSASNFFFWDTINIVAAPAMFFHDTNFTSFVLPNNIDTGHIPSMGFYLALIWKVFGRSLLISHLAVLPFLFGIIYQLHQLVSTFISTTKFQFLALILILADATFLSQSVMISSDIGLLFFFLLGLNAVLKNQNPLLVISLVGLFLISLRGSIAAFSLLMIDIILNYKTVYSLSFKLILKRIIVIYTFPFMVLVGFHYYHYLTTGWIGSHVDSPWEGGIDHNNLKGVLYNTGILTWRILDFGRVFILLFFVLLLVSHRKKITKSITSNKLIIICGVVGVLLALPFFYFKMQTQHRYLLPFYILLTLFVAYLITELNIATKLKTGLFILLTLLSLSGNFWVYPNKIAQGWDATLGHIPFYDLQRTMNNYLDEHQIDFNEVGTAFPMLGNHSTIFLTNDTRSFKPKNVGEDNYVLYSNVFNDFSDEELQSLATNYSIIKEVKSSTVFLQLYEIK